MTTRQRRPSARRGHTNAAPLSAATLVVVNLDLSPAVCDSVSVREVYQNCRGLLLLP